MKMPAYRAAGAALALCLTLGLSGCDDLLDVDLPTDLTGETLDDPISATSQLNSAIVLYENAMSRFMYIIHGHEDGGEVVLMSPSIGTGEFNYRSEAPNFGDFMQARTFAKGLHDKLAAGTGGWGAVPNRPRTLAMTSIYEGAIYSWMASTLCEGALDAGPLMTQTQMAQLAEQTLTRAITEIGAAGGDFAMPFNISNSALNMAHGLRAQSRWATGDIAGAKADAERIPQGFNAYLTRENTATRRNFAFYNGPGAKFAALQGVVDWWQSSLRQPNPATGEKWPAVIPFTGYTELGILPNGRATREDGLPIRLAGATIEQKYRTPEENTAVRDTRTPHIIGIVGGRATPTYIASKFNSGEAQYMPLVNWQEMVLIRAEADGGQAAIDRVNQLRQAAGLPLVTYLTAGDTQGIRRMIIEERRRALMLEGRYYYTKLKNLDLTWFPRLQGSMPNAGQQYQGGVKMAMPDNEYHLNPNILDLNKRGSGCDAKSKPVY